MTLHALSNAAVRRGPPCAVARRLILLGLIPAVLAPVARTQCQYYEDRLHWVGGLATPGSVECVAAEGERLVLADEVAGLLVVDISDPQYPQLTGSVDSLLSIRGLAIQGDLAFATRDTLRLDIVDLSDPRAPRVIGSVRTPDVPYGVAASGDYVYVAAYGAGLLVCDISTPETPRVVASLDSPGSSFGVAVADTLVFVADGSAGFFITNVSDPTRPAFLGVADTRGIASYVGVQGSFAYVGDLSHQLYAIDVSNPRVPKPRSSVDTSGALRGFVLGTGHAYAATGGGSVGVVLTVDPSGLTNFPGIATPGQSLGIAMSGDHVYVAAGSAGLQVARVSALTAVEPVSSVDMPSWASAISVRRGVACIANSSYGLRVVDVSDLGRPQAVGTLPLSYATGTASRAWHAYVTDLYLGLNVVNVSEPRFPWVETRLEIPGNANDIVLAGDLAYVAAGNSGLQVVDVSELLAPRLLGAVDTVFASDLDVSGDYVYLAGLRQLWVVWAFDPLAPEIVGSVELPGTATGLVAGDGCVYVTAETAGLCVVDVSVPTVPAYVRSLPMIGVATDVDRVGPYLYCVSRQSETIGAGLMVADITDAEKPRVLGRSEIPWGAQSVKVYGSIVYTGEMTDKAGLRLYPAQCGGATAVTVSGVAAVAEAGAVRVLWDVQGGGRLQFFVARATGSGLPEDAYQVLNPEAPIDAEGPWEYRDVRVAPGELYSYLVCARYPDGGQTLHGPVTARPGPAARLRLLTPAPNPVVRGTTLGFDLGCEADVCLEVCDPAGRRVITLWDGPAGPGQHPVRWEGCDDRGRGVASGVYWVRLRSGHGLAAERLLLLR